MKNTTKFIKITTKHTKEELAAFVANMSASELDNLSVAYDKFDYVEFDNEDGFECMFAVINEAHISELLDMYVALSVNFSYEDLTKEALYSSLDTSTYNTHIDDINKLIEAFIDSNLDVDTVLDKMLDLGKESLNDKDMLVLTSI
jgi:hypothetical protein